MILDQEQELSRRERQIMDAVYAAGTVTAADVVEALPDKPSNSTVRTLLRILVNKGHLKQKRDGQRYLYRPTRSRPQAAQGALKRVVQTFFGGSVEQAVEGLLQAPDIELSEAQLDRIHKMIENTRREGR
jgi:BlaI family transcriptional regulator, penicillinase repressor